MRILLVRHADAGARWADDEEDRHRPLTERGLAEAAGLPSVLSGFRVGQVLSSPARRCRETVAPLATAAGLEVVDDPDLFEGRGAACIHHLERDADDDLVLCTHGDVIPEVLGTLERRGTPLPRPVRWEKASTWVLHRRHGGTLVAEYLPPPPAG